MAGLGLAVGHLVIIANWHESTVGFADTQGDEAHAALGSEGDERGRFLECDLRPVLLVVIGGDARHTDSRQEGGAFIT